MADKKGKIDKLSKNLQELKDWLLEVDGNDHRHGESARDNGRKEQIKNYSVPAKGTAILDKEGHFTFTDNTFAEMFGYTEPGVLISKKWQILFDADTAEKFSKKILPELKETGSWQGELTGTRQDGSNITISLELTKTPDDLVVWRVEKQNNRGEVSKMGVTDKVVELRKGLKRLQEAGTKGDIYNTTLTIAENILELDFCVLYLEESNTLMVKGGEERKNGNYVPSILGGGLSSLTIKRDKVIWGEDPEEYTQFEPTPEDISGFISVPIDSMGTIQVVSSEDAFTEEDVNLLQILAQHFSERVKRAEVEGDLREQAIHDQLTSLYNRHYLNEILTKEVERAQRYKHSLSFLMVDINGFKEVNDCYTHSKGDKVLVEVGNLLRKNVREMDTVFRYGGDEFLILLPETGEGSEMVTQRLKEEMENWNRETDLLDFPLTLAIGSSNFDPEDEVGAEEKIEEADREMYRDKNHG